MIALMSGQRSRRRSAPAVGIVNHYFQNLDIFFQIIGSRPILPLIRPVRGPDARLSRIALAALRPTHPVDRCERGLLRRFACNPLISPDSRKEKAWIFLPLVWIFLPLAWIFLP